MFAPLLRSRRSLRALAVVLAITCTGCPFGCKDGTTEPCYNEQTHETNC